VRERKGSMTEHHSLAEVADLVRRKAAGEYGALDGAWGDEVVLWHCWDEDGRESRRPMATQETSSRQKHEVLKARRPDFGRQSTIHISESTGRVIEESVWSGTKADGTSARLYTCIIYRVQHGRITRMDIYDDEARSKAFSEGWPEHLKDENLVVRDA
jgi:hypothetical protein